MDPEELYFRLGELVATMPNLDADGQLTSEMQMWLGRAHVLVERAVDMVERVKFTVASENLQVASPIRASHAGTIRAVVYRALAHAESRAPASARGAFIAAGDPFTAMTHVRNVLKVAKRDMLIVDPYMDEAALMDFGPLIPEPTTVRLLADKDKRRLQPTLRPAVERWKREYGDKRPLEARLTPARALHDRAIFVDGQGAWVLTQSLKDFAERSPGVIFKVDKAIADLKIPAYEELWNNADPV